MADRAVRAGANQFVPFLEGDHAAPVRAEMPAGPKCDRYSGGGEKDANPCSCQSIGKKTSAQPADAQLLTRQQTKGDDEGEHIAQALDPGFALFCSFELERGN